VGEDYQNEIEGKLRQFDQSLNSYDSTSIISRMNRNDSTAEADSLFETCFNKAREVSAITNGAFDITVGPLVNAWGFGFKNAQFIDSALIDSLMYYVGYKKVRLDQKKIIKEDKNIVIDVNAIAQGFSVDIIAAYLESKQIKNYMVEIGGELRVKGVNEEGGLWRIGIDKPIEGSDEENRELQDIVLLNSRSISTSGNYRQFYVKDGIKYAHTIDPKTGYPAMHSLLSATVLADDCMTADAYATACMVLGVAKSIELAKKLDYLDVYLIYTDSSSNYRIYYSKGFDDLIEAKDSVK